jgi:hypothetical protein
LDFVPDVNLHTRTQNILERLIEVQDSPGVFPLIPPETRVRLVITDADAPGVYVDFSSEFHNNFSGTTAQAHMMLQSIVHTVLENNRQRSRVFFLIDSDRWEEFHGVSGFDMGFTADESFMLGFVPEEYE